MTGGFCPLNVPGAPPVKVQFHVEGAPTLRSVNVTFIELQPVVGVPENSAVGAEMLQLDELSRTIPDGPQTLFITLRDKISFPPATSLVAINALRSVALGNAQCITLAGASMV